MFWIELVAKFLVFRWLMAFVVLPSFYAVFFLVFILIRLAHAGHPVPLVVTALIICCFVTWTALRTDNRRRHFDLATEQFSAQTRIEPSFAPKVRISGLHANPDDRISRR